MSQKPLTASAPPRFEEVFSAHFGYVWTLLRRFGVARRDLEDLTHDVFVQALRALEAYDTTRPIRPWLFGIALNAASNYRRLARHRLELVDSVPEPAGDGKTAESELILAQEKAVLERALQKLELERRAVLILHEIEGHSIPEFAQILGVPLNTAYSRLRLARHDFEAAVNRLQLRRPA